MDTGDRGVYNGGIEVDTRVDIMHIGEDTRDSGVGQSVQQ